MIHLLTKKFKDSLALIIVFFLSFTVSFKRTIVASHDTADARRKFEHVGHSGGVQQLVLYVEDRSKCHTAGS